MPKIEVTTMTTTIVEIAPRLKLKLMERLRAYRELYLQIKERQVKMDKLKEEIGTLRDDTGEGSIEVDGFKVTLVAGLQRKFNPKKFVAAGGDLKLYNASFDEVPKKAYEKITLPGSKENED